MRPFWVITFGIALAWLIKSGRAQAMIDAVTAPPASTSSGATGTPAVQYTNPPQPVPPGNTHPPTSGTA